MPASLPGDRSSIKNSADPTIDTGTDQNSRRLLVSFKNHGDKTSTQIGATFCKKIVLAAVVSVFAKTNSVHVVA